MPQICKQTLHWYIFEYVLNHSTWAVSFTCCPFSHHTPSDITTVQTWATFSSAVPIIHNWFWRASSLYIMLWQTPFSTADLTCLKKQKKTAPLPTTETDSMTSSGNTLLLHVWQQHTNMSHSLSTCFTDSAVYPCKLHPYHFHWKCNYLNMTEWRKLLDFPLYVSHYCYCKADCSDIFNISKKCVVTMGQTQNKYPTNIPAPPVHNCAPVTCIKSGLTQCTIIFIAYSLFMQSNCQCT